MPEQVKHDRSDAVVVGTRLQPGDELKSGDVYASTNGTWEENSCPKGAVIADKCTTLWVRPQV